MTSCFFGLLLAYPCILNSVALRTAKTTTLSFGRSVCNRVKGKTLL